MRTIILCAFFGLLFTSCSKDRLTASGDKTTETRSPGNFTGINSSGSTPVHVTYGNEFKVVLKGSDNLVPHFKTTVTGNILYLEYEHVNVQHDDVEVYVTMPAINYVSLSGSAELDINGQFPSANDFKVSVSGSGEVEVDEPFTVNKAEVDVSGSGTADLEKLDSKMAEVDVSGSGDVKIKVQDELKASISGSGKIFYTGNPRVDSQISGSGKIIKF